MRHKLALLVTLTAWLFATGSQWDVVQTFAWARMFAENARTLSFGAALERTFSPEGRCELCGAVSTAKRQQSDADGGAPGGKADGKLVLVFQPVAAVILTPPGLAPWSPDEPPCVSTERAAPPLPPPRA
jgi:hypothetical protein